MTAQNDLAVQELALENGGWFIYRLDVNYGARTLAIDAEYDGKPFVLRFKDFHLFSWQFFRDEDEYDPREILADVLGFDLGERGGRKSAVIHADLFEIIVSYSEMVLQKDW